MEFVFYGIWEWGLVIWTKFGFIENCHQYIPKTFKDQSQFYKLLIPNPIYLMFKMSCARYYHSHIVLFTELDAFIIPYRTTRMNYSRDTRIMRHAHTIVEWEKCIRGHYRTLQCKAKLV